MEVRASMLPSHLDGGFHIVCQDDELRWSTIVMGAKTYEGEAEQAGLTFARKWIDDGKPPLRESGTGSS